MLSEEVHEVVGLQDHVAEFGVGDALVAVGEALADGVLLDHHVDGEVLADVAEHIEVGDGAEPVEVVDHDGAVGEVG